MKKHPATQFLEANGFKEVKPNTYKNNACEVFISLHRYIITDRNGDVMLSDDFNMYWLVGILTWHGFIDKNYKSLNAGRIGYFI